MPVPDDWLAPVRDNPEARYTLRERVSVAFLTAMHRLPPRQRVALIEREVLDWPASEAAAAPCPSVRAVKSTLHRARTRASQR